MSHWVDELRTRQDVVTVPRVWVTIAVSILIHLAVLFLWTPPTHLLNPGEEAEAQNAERLEVVLEAPPTPTPSSPPPEPAPVQAPRPAPPRPSRAIVRLEPPRLVAPPTPEAIAIPPPPPVLAQPKPTPPIEGDLAAYIAARRRERGEVDAAPVNEAAQFNKTIAANLPAAARGIAAKDTKESGGVFQIKRMTYDDAAFDFYGWNEEMRRKTPQLIEVRKGSNPNMETAVVRKMIAIIRTLEKEDFVWDSPKLGHTITLSARVSDNAALEAFLMKEFFENPRGSR
jgi:hypothetical protein